MTVSKVSKIVPQISVIQ